MYLRARRNRLIRRVVADSVLLIIILLIYYPYLYECKYRKDDDFISHPVSQCEDIHNVNVFIIDD